MKKVTPHRFPMLPALLMITFLISIQGSAQSPIFVGHRGASHLAPENTIASIQLAWELGAAAAECDVMVTADKQVVVFHDKNGKRLTGKDFKVKETHYEQMKDLPIQLRETNLEKYDGATIPLLSDVLTTIPPDRTLVIEIKTGPEIMPCLEKVINENWKTGHIAFISFDIDAILAAKKSYPEVPCYYLSMFKREVISKTDKILAGELDGVNLRHKIIDKKLVNKFNRAGLDVWCWTVNDPDDARRMIKAGVSAITTDRPVWLREQVM